MGSLVNLSPIARPAKHFFWRAWHAHPAREFTGETPVPPFLVLEIFIEAMTAVCYKL
jgi:hypothetical protein